MRASGSDDRNNQGRRGRRGPLDPFGLLPPPPWELLAERDVEANLFFRLLDEGSRQMRENVEDAIAPWISSPEIKDTVDPEKLAYSDSRFMQVTDEVKLHYTQARSSKLEEGAPGVLCIHGFNGSTVSWREVIQQMGETVTSVAGAGAVVAYDRPPFGLSSRPVEWKGGDANNPYITSSGAKFGLQLLDKLGLDDTILIGHSAGAAVAVQAAIQAPERVKALVLVAPAVFVDSPLAGAPLSTYLNLLYTRSMLLIPGVNLNFMRREILKKKEAIEQTRKIGFYDESQVTDELIHGYTRPLLAHDWDVGSLIQYQSMALDVPPLEELRKMGDRIPVLILQGREDPTVPATVARRLKQVMGDKVQYVEWAQCGHLPMDEDPQRFLEAVQPFLASVLEENNGKLLDGTITPVVGKADSERAAPAPAAAASSTSGVPTAVADP